MSEKPLLRIAREFNTYQAECRTNAQWEGPGASRLGGLPPLVYCISKMAGEAGETVEKLMKIYRDKEGVMSEEDRSAIILELGDVLWYVGQAAMLLGCTFSHIAWANLKKLADRRARGVLRGSGDNR